MLAALLFGFLSTAIGVTASWVPSLWTDEVATLNAVERSWEGLWILLADVDAVHGAYYALVKPWVDVAGVTPFPLRLPSAIAIGLATAGTVALMWQLAGRVSALWAGVVMTMLPASTGFAIEARSGAFAMAAVVWATLFLVLALRGRRGWWVAYAGALIVAGALFLPALSIVLAHAITAASTTRRRSALVTWSISVVVAAAALAPLALLASRQTAQIDWVPEPTLTYVAGTFAAAAWFGESLLVGAVAWVLILLVLWRRRQSGAWEGRPSVISTAAPWLIVPGVALLAASLVVSPMFVARYLAFCAPAAALLAACGLMSLDRTLRFVAAAALLAVCLPVAIGQRTEFAKDGADWSAAAREVAAVADAGDAVVFISDGGQPRSPRRALEAYPQEFEGLDDVGLQSTAQEADRLWGTGVPLEEAAPALRAQARSWGLVSLISVGGSVEEAEARFARVGLDSDLVWRGPSTLVFALTSAG